LYLFLYSPALCYLRNGAKPTVEVGIPFTGHVSSQSHIPL
jgi:hypothetical protein